LCIVVSTKNTAGSEVITQKLKFFIYILTRLELSLALSMSYVGCAVPGIPTAKLICHLRTVFSLPLAYAEDRLSEHVRVNVGRLSYVLSNNSGEKMNLVHQHHYNLWFQTALAQDFDVLWP